MDEVVSEEALYIFILSIRSYAQRLIKDHLSCENAESLQLILYVFCNHSAGAFYQFTL